MSLDRRPNPLAKIKLVNLLILVLIFAAGLSYLFGMNRLMVSGFKLQALKRQVAALSDENQDIENQRVDLESYPNLEQRLKDLNMVAVDKVDYLQAQPGLIAKE
jgi:hypothetical protein